MNIPTNLKYAKSDEWFDPATGKMGLTDYAQDHLSDVVYFENKVDAGDTVAAGQEVASVDSVKANSSIYAPVSGKVAQVNEELTQAYAAINTDPYGAGWMLVIEGGDASGMMDAAAYIKYCEERAS